MLLALLARNWWVFLVRGIAAILFGILALTHTAATALSLVVVLGAYALIDGAGTIVTAIGGRGQYDRWVLMLISGIAGVLLGLAAFLHPAAVGAAMMLYIGLWAIVIGVTQIMTGIRLRKEIQGEFWLILSGLLAILFGVSAIGTPGLAGLVTVQVMGWCVIGFGIILCLLAFKVRGLART